ncbi:hypothetical protein ACKWTF_002417 [Chironomus riparius]
MNRLVLKNVPISMTKAQITSIFFPELEHIEINFPKRNNNNYNITRNVLIRLNSKNEAILCSRFINRLEFQNVEASIAEVDTNKSNNRNVQRCAFCGDMNAEFMCNDCSTLFFSTFYCCKDHQERDWSRHKIECKSLPALRRVDDLTEIISNTNHTNEKNDYNLTENESQSIKKGKYKIQTMDIKPNCKVVITFVTDTRLFYIRSLCLESNDLMNTIRHYSKSAPVILKKPSIDEYVLVNNHRAKVLDLFETDQNVNARVILADFGNEVETKWQDMKHLNYKIRGKPSYTQKVILNDVPNEKYDRNVDNYLQKLSLDQEILEVVEIFGNQINGLKVVLKHSQTGHIINEVIKTMLNNDQDEKYFYDVNKLSKLATSSSIKIFITDSSQLENQKLLSCIPYEKLSDYLLMLDELKKYCKRISNEPYSTPALNEVCIVKYKEQWHRASCSDSNSQSEFIKFILIDLMINVKIIRNNVRKIPQLFSKHFYTSLCYVNEENVAKIKQIIEKDKFIHACIRYDSKTKCHILNNLL